MVRGQLATTRERIGKGGGTKGERDRGLVTGLEREAVGFFLMEHLKSIFLDIELINSFLHVFKFLNSVLANKLVCHSDYKKHKMVTYYNPRLLLESVEHLRNAENFKFYSIQILKSQQVEINVAALGLPKQFDQAMKHV